MSAVQRTFPKSVQPGIPHLSATPVGWTKYRFGDLFDVVKRPLEMKDDAEYDLVTVKRSRGGIEHRGRMLGRKISVKTQFHIQEGDFLISKRQIVHGACGFVGQEFDGSIVSNEYSVLVPKQILHFDYLRYLVHSIYVQQTFFHSSIGVHIEKMIFKLEEWFKWPINLPPLAEQERVAKMFLATEGKITLLAKKKTALEDYKGGVMRRLFSRELRFANDDGSAFPDWDERKFGDVVVRVGDKFDPRKSDENPFLVELENIEGKTGRILGFSRLEGQRSLKTRFAIGDVLFGKLRPYLKKHAHPDFEGVCSSEIWVLRSEEISSLFLFYLVQADQFVRLANISAGSKMPRADWRVLADSEFEIPHPNEQRKIADFLSAIDAKITAVSAQISEMETFKKGLLQKIFV
ncbi:hypothetical protein GG681_09070 [Epibacterium sp. SM1969]|uniref:Type I restriction modification DNA specificity domain-containing protein n=1 Tax=Tritonibacter aquimaris TaxID=2663379 RepID=A0A844AXX8_9RHOB|nr:restriction endonuclease subunit S [Tritonibacter aquimaris]MQY42792.1 hypothetical protein [Tritonibacter aquimaris]